MIVINLNPGAQPEWFSLQLAAFEDYLRTNYPDLVKDAYRMEVYGDKRAEDHYDFISDIYALFGYLVQIWYFKRSDETNNVSRAVNYYYDTYDLECMARGLNCRGFDAYPVYQQFGLYTDPGYASGENNGIGQGTVRGFQEPTEARNITVN